MKKKKETKQEESKNPVKKSTKKTESKPKAKKIGVISIKGGVGKTSTVSALGSALSNFYGIQTMLNLGFKKAFSLILVVAAFSGVSLSLVMVPLYKSIGSATTILAVEMFVTFAFVLELFSVWKNLL